MIVKLAKLSSAMSKVADLVVKERHVPGVMFDMQDDGFKLCYTGSGKTFEEKIEATIEETDPTGQILFEYEAFSRIIEACKPIGNIITDNIKIEFRPKIATVKAEKMLVVLRKDGSIKYKKRGSVIEQEINWISTSEPNVSVKLKSLFQSRYDLYRHYPDEYIAEHYPNENELKPLSDLEFANESDTWDRDELRTILNRLSIEDNTLITINDKYNIAFVKLENSCIVIPLRKKIKNKLIQSASGAKALASILGRLDSSIENVTLHTVGGNNLVVTSDDESMVTQLTNLKQNGSITSAKGYMAREFSSYIMNFNRELLENILTGAKMSGSPEKITFAFEYTDDSGIREVPQQPSEEELEGQTEMAPEDEDMDAELENQFSEEDDEDVEVGDSGDVSDEQLEADASAIGDIMADEESNKRYVKMVMTISNTNKAIENKYEILPDVVIDRDNSITGLSISVGLDMLLQAVKAAKTQFVGFDVDMEQAKNGSVSLRIGEIDLKEMARISMDEHIDKKWPEAKTIEHRKDIIGYMTFMSATKLDATK